MKKHQVIFDKIKEFLTSQFGDRITEFEDGTHLTIGDSGIWISSDDRELTVGYGMIHTHYDAEYDDLNQAVEQFFNLLTKRKRITEFLKGKFVYKLKAEIELNEANYEEIGTSMTWLFPYWKRTVERVAFDEKLIAHSEIEGKIDEIKNYAQQGAVARPVDEKPES